ncbi:MAG: FAD-dependent thymidylate synthase [Desulfurobacteriaceae bacterium]
MKVLLVSKNLPPLKDEKAFLRHSYFTFLIEGISRACSHQLVRHRPASYSQQSQRYVAMKNFPYVVPDSIKGKKEEDKYHKLMETIGSFYEELVSKEIPREDARFVLPNACTTRILFTMNGEELVHFLRLRTCNRAQWEIRKMAILMLKILRKEVPSVFNKVGPNCYFLGYCTEGKKSCGKQLEVKRYFSSSL